ncbi:two-component system LytT family response regulator [Chryseobacterium sp. H1D6B]|uniref:LytR/AlgR family response regulator transcription factor n=1 Tax=Chryseobacterium sp. H1D6B TaxID=2940588 RepID=UPI0015CBD279|nr:LytTR family DNA-binding domain-containing protein [Chryseobacterium sp. H1D6B]MDH6254093.1 two-component system LytT family response regulator [Chryseobacterium sp. H1D6B]
MKTKLQVCIVEEQDDGESTSLLLKKEFPEFEISFKTNNIKDAFIYLKKNSPDLLFLNIQLPIKSETEFLLKIIKNQLWIIFITDSEKSAIQAIKKGITDCLLKPVKNLDFVIAVNKALENFKKNRNPIFNQNIQNRINLPTLQGFKRVSINEIIRCEADSNYTFIYLSDHTKVIVSKTLYDFEKHLSHHNFFRIHHKHLINLSHLKEYIKGKGGQVIMDDNSVLDVSVRKKNDFLQKIA